MLRYKLHTEKSGLSRFDKGTPQTYRSLKALVNRGVDVKLDVPFEMWDQPSVEITSLYKQCVNMISDFEDELEDWFYHHQEDDLLRYFCRERVLKKSDQACLSEKVFRSSKAKIKTSTGAKRSDL
ncbi:hypothetical protein PHET_09237 [Paragonimus heterotremus]|uniref:DUF3456 domain-containing protein n=1 Tax=Paragonimus heterotremus TaxID=100268 RepID=A0A8J4TAC0_9TREM|nr:hypothetical protein PHET_09237 [Paragonimus heterotremus]